MRLDGSGGPLVTAMTMLVAALAARLHAAPPVVRPAPPLRAPDKPAAKPPVVAVPKPVPASQPGPVQLDLAAEANAQFNDLLKLIAARDRQPATQEALRPDALILPGDRDPVDVILRRTTALLHDIRRRGPRYDLSAAEAQLRRLRAEADLTSPQVQEQVVKDRRGRESRLPTLLNPEPRLDLFTRICQVRRQIAFANPLLNFDRLLFLKTYRHRPGHICDQFFGSHVGGGPGGGIYVLRDPFGSQPFRQNLLLSSPVQNGRLKGSRLDGGSFLAPDVSFDGRTLLFAYTECAGGRRPTTADSRQGIWPVDSAYHVFRVNADGTGLVQLTDGGWNDFDPCWLPDGRIVFISERRGGYGRCHGRPVPTYTLHAMNADGSGILPLSYHETNEWQPSVSHDGMVLYTRWDYVDRGDCIAHHPWITTPDGRDARAIQGNYPAARHARPDAELDVRAIPGSRRLVATAGPHHGQSFGSFILIDPDQPDDGAMGPLKRLTPDNGFPETQGGKGLYGTPWPLSEDYHLCVYGGPRKDGIYLIDSFGNKELIYHDPAIECLSPMPLAPRPRPRIIPHATAIGRPVEGSINSHLPLPSTRPSPPPAGTATVTCINVYDGLLPWPDGTKIKGLRVIQLFPKATASMDNPPISRWSESLARGVLGTVPVEPDGSAYFTVPAGKTLYFQALDEQGMAIQSMQSATYLHPGERLTCQGCHEQRHQAPPPPKAVPLALRRGPSTIQPEMDGSYPVSFPRLVQPVLEKHCVACHAREAKAPKLGAELSGKGRRARAGGWTAAYNVLAAKGYGLSGKPPSRSDVRTVPGQFGARASALLKLLQEGHHDVKLAPAELRRITLWLDCNSNFYGAYHDLEAQSRGELVMPPLE